MKNQGGSFRLIHRLPVFLLAVCMMLAAALPAYAASRTKITSVKVKITDTIIPGTRFGTEDIEVETGTGHYDFDTYEIDNDGFEWREDETPQITIYLRVDDADKYYFSSLVRNNLSITGGTYVSGTLKTEDSAEVLCFSVQLTPMNERVGNVEQATLTDSGYVYWEPAVGAGSYDLRIYRNGTLATVTDLTVQGTEYNLKDYMNRAGSYYVRIRACNAVKPENKSEWLDTVTVTISAERANEIRDGLTLERPLTGEWMNTGNGWWYLYSDGSYPVGWAFLDGHWYYFDQDGYMATGWIESDGKEYYMDDNTGRLLTNTTTPDGYVVDENGNKKNSR